jgi:hypothetical protein
MTQAFNLSQFANYLNSSGQVSNSGLQTPAVSPIPSGTLMLFQQTSAPTGWTKQTTHDNKALRVVSGTAGTGGSVAFTTAFGTPAVSGSVGATTLSTAQMPSHQHLESISSDSVCGGSQAVNGGGSFGGRSTGATGGGGSHTHSLSGATTTINVSYVDLIIASYN